MIDDRIKQKLKYLFNVAENDASSDGEIANAMRAARNLMNAHQISREDIKDDVVEVTYGLNHRYSLYTSLCAWESYVCKFITEFVGGVGYYVQRGQIRRNSHGMACGKATKITFYGPELDIVFACELFDELTYFIQSASRLRYGNALSRGEAASYAEGFAKGLYEANKKEVEQLEASSDSMALTVINRNLMIKKEGRNWLSSEHGVRLSKGRSISSAAHKNLNAFRQGEADGRGYSPSTTKKAGYLCD